MPPDSLCIVDSRPATRVSPASSRRPSGEFRGALPFPMGAELAWMLPAEVSIGQRWKNYPLDPPAKHPALPLPARPMISGLFAAAQQSVDSRIRTCHGAHDIQVLPQDDPGGAGNKGHVPAEARGLKQGTGLQTPAFDRRRPGDRPAAERRVV